MSRKSEINSKLIRKGNKEEEGKEDRDRMRREPRKFVIFDVAAYCHAGWQRVSLLHG
jgi:hypothetical protein